jgi:hypothetical protein
MSAFIEEVKMNLWISLLLMGIIASAAIGIVAGLQSGSLSLDGVGRSTGPPDNGQDQPAAPFAEEEEVNHSNETEDTYSEGGNAPEDDTMTTVEENHSNASIEMDETTNIMFHSDGDRRKGTPLQIEDGNGSNAVWELQNMLPGDTTTARFNVSSTEDRTDLVRFTLSIESVDPGCRESSNEEPDTLCGAEGMASMFRVERMVYGNYVVTTSEPGGLVQDQNDNDYVDLEDLAAVSDTEALHGLDAPSGGQMKPVELTVTFHEQASNAYQGDATYLSIGARGVSGIAGDAS